jgi:hypothetical protein
MSNHLIPAQKMMGMLTKPYTPPRQTHQSLHFVFLRAAHNTPPISFSLSVGAFHYSHPKHITQYGTHCAASPSPVPPANRGSPIQNGG